MIKKRSQLSSHTARPVKSVRSKKDKNIDFSDLPEATDQELNRARRVGRRKPGNTKIVNLRIQPTEKLGGHKEVSLKGRKPHLGTGHVRTYPVRMNVTLSIEEQVIVRARKKAEAMGKSLNQMIREYLEKGAGNDDPERSIAELKRLLGRGHSRGWRFNRDEIHERS